MKFDCRKDYLLLAELIRQVGNHDLGGAGNTILRGTSLLLLNQRLVVGLVGSIGNGLRSNLDVGRLNQRKNLARNVGGKDGLLLLARAVFTAAGSTLEMTG